MPVIITSVPDVYFRALERFAIRQKDWRLVVVHETAIAQAREYPASGIIVHANREALRDAVRGLGLPAVNTSCALADPGFPRVATDGQAAGRMAAGLLIRRGFRDIAILGQARRHYSQVRGLGVAAAVAAAGGRCHACDVDLDGHADGRRCLDWMAGLPAQTACVAVSDLVARWWYMLLERHHQPRPPMIGIDDDARLCASLDPPLSSIGWPDEAIGQAAAACLAEQLAGRTVPAEHLLPPSGISERTSTAVWACSDPTLLPALRWISEHACGPAGIDDLAVAIGMSRRSLERRFAAATGHGPRWHFEQQRLEAARNLLRHSRRSVADIAATCGFASSWWFARRFCAVYGATPLAWRRQAARQDGAC